MAIFRADTALDMRVFGLARVSRWVASYCAVLLLAIASDSRSEAAFVTTKEAELDAIYGQTSFGSNPVDVRFLPTIEHVAPGLLDITSAGEMTTLISLYGPAPTIFVYYVDTIDWCGSFNTNIVGCGIVSGNDFAVESNYAASSNGAELIGHELGHTLGLNHHPAPNNDNLMDSVVGSSPGPPQTVALTPSQVATILSNFKVLEDAGGKYVRLQPVLIVASEQGEPFVPEPAGLGLAIMALGVVGARRRRRISYGV